MTRLTFSAGNHAYYLKDPDTGRKTRVTSVTTLLNLLAKPALVKWAARSAADYAVDHWDDLAALPLTERQKMIAGAPEQSRDQKAASGTAIHSLAEDMIAGPSGGRSPRPPAQGGRTRPVVGEVGADPAGLRAPGVER